MIFARTETAAFQEFFKRGDGYLFLAKRLRFYHVDGREGACATAPSVLIALDNEFSNGMNQRILEQSELKGAYFDSAVRCR